MRRKFFRRVGKNLGWSSDCVCNKLSGKLAKTRRRGSENVDGTRVDTSNVKNVRMQIFCFV